MIRSLTVRADIDNRVAIEFRTIAIDGKLAKPKEIIELLGLDPVTIRITKKKTHL